MLPFLPIILIAAGVLILAREMLQEDRTNAAKANKRRAGRVPGDTPGEQRDAGAEPDGSGSVVPLPAKTKGSKDARLVDADVAVGAGDEPSDDSRGEPDPATGVRDAKSVAGKGNGNGKRTGRKAKKSPQGKGGAEAQAGAAKDKEAAVDNGNDDT